MFKEIKEHGARGLSPSSFAKFNSCQRQYYHHKVAKTPIDPDVEEDVESLQIGKAFHKCLEITKHELQGFPLSRVDEIAREHGLNVSTHTPLLMAMLSQYKIMHKKAGLKAIACEVEISTADFYGFVDVILMDESGRWWIGDMKTAASFRPDIVPSLLMHPQINLYAAMRFELEQKLKLKPVDYMGCRYRLTTKSKISRKEGEETKAYVARLSKAIKSIDFILPVERMDVDDDIVINFMEATKAIKDKGTIEAKYSQNFDNCMKWFRPCEFWSRCHGKTYTELKDVLDFVDNEP